MSGATESRAIFSTKFRGAVVGIAATEILRSCDWHRTIGSASPSKTLLHPRAVSCRSDRRELCSAGRMQGVSESSAKGLHAVSPLFASWNGAVTSAINRGHGDAWCASHQAQRRTNTSKCAGCLLFGLELIGFEKWASNSNSARSDPRFGDKKCSGQRPARSNRSDGYCTRAFDQMAAKQHFL